MNRLFLSICLLLAALFTNAQTTTLWYGVNYGNETNNRYNNSKEWRFANFGIDYTSPINKTFDWTAGLGYNTKGGSLRANYIQAEGNVGYNFIKTDAFAMKILTGPFIAVKVNSDYEADYAPDQEIVPSGKGGYNTFSCGWQAGLGISYKIISLKIGYEHAFTNIESEVDRSHKTFEWFARIGIRL